MSSKKKIKVEPTVRKISSDVFEEIVCLTDGDLKVGSEICIRTLRGGKTEAIWLRLKTQEAVDNINDMFPNVVISA